MPATKSNPAAAETFASRVAITRLIHAPRALVFAAWTDPQHLARWCHLDAFKTEKMEVDARVGGQWNITVRTPDGGEISIRRVFREIVAHERIVFYEKCSAGEKILLDGTHTILFADENGGTRIDISCDLATPFDADNQQGWGAGWGQLLDRLASHVKG